jgi:hypothetical protein
MSDKCGLFTQPHLNFTPGAPAVPEADAFDFEYNDGQYQCRLRTVTPKPELAEKILQRDYLDALTNEAMQQTGIPQSTRKTFRIGPMVGVEGDAVLRDGGGAKCRLFIFGDTFYVFTVVHTRKWEPAKADEFLNSVRMVFRKGGG